MKANEAPEEIYLLPDERNPNGLSICWYEAPYATGSIEYTRTDAFIEKAAKWLEDNAIEYWGTEAVDNGMMIDDFKIAMKVDIVMDE